MPSPTPLDILTTAVTQCSGLGLTLPQVLALLPSVTGRVALNAEMAKDPPTPPLVAPEVLSSLRTYLLDDSSVSTQSAYAITRLGLEQGDQQTVVFGFYALFKAARVQFKSLDKDIIAGVIAAST